MSQCLKKKMLFNPSNFKKNYNKNINNTELKKSLFRSRKIVDSRKIAIKSVSDFELLRNYSSDIKNISISNLHQLLINWEKNAKKNGTIVHWAENYEDVNKIIYKIAKKNKVKNVIKSKSMLTEESGLNDYLIKKEIKVTETDLGEYIIQNSNEPPSHIIAPAIHKSKEQVSELFSRIHKQKTTNNIEELTQQARENIRPHFFNADMGITGANFLISDSGSTVIVTNEGNGRMTNTLPKVHVAVTSIEKCISNFEELSLMLRVLTRSATSQNISNYISITTGAKKQKDLDGPKEFHVILMDVGRTKILESDTWEILKCIRCGACMNHCPVYHTIGGHPYGWVYPGPMGSILNSSLLGNKIAGDLPYASTLCNQCGVVCPVKIPLPELMVKLRNRKYKSINILKFEKIILTFWAFISKNPRIFNLFTLITRKILKLQANKNNYISSILGLKFGWFIKRFLPKPK